MLDDRRLSRMCDVFISYKREDEKTAEFVAKALERRKWSVWCDRNLRGGERVDETIERQLESARCVVVLWSRSSVGSEYVKTEAGYALDRGVLVPAMIDPEIKPPFRFGGTHTENLIGWAGDESDPRFVKFIQAVEQKLRSSVSKSGKKLNVYIPGGGFGGARVQFSPDLPKLVYPIGDKPLLYELLDSLDPAVVSRVIILNRRAPELIETLVNVKKSEYKFDVLCHELEARKNWPQGLKDMLTQDIAEELKPKETFLIQLCDVILRERHWKRLVRDHFYKKSMEEEERNHLSEGAGGPYLGTLVVSRSYMIKAGIVRLGAGDFDREVAENPEGEYLQAEVNTGTAVLESEILNYVNPDDMSLLGGAIKDALSKNNSFGAYRWDKWEHLLNPIDWQTTHQKSLEKIKQKRQPDQGMDTMAKVLIGGVENRGKIS